MKDRIIQLASPDFVPGDDGYLMWWPDGFNRGGLSSESLRIIADELDIRNKPWDDELTRYFKGQVNENRSRND